MEKFLESVPLEQRVVGYRRVIREMRSSRIRCVLIARDADESIAASVTSLCSEKNVPCSFVLDKKTMGEMLGLDVACAVCGEAIESANTK